VTRLHVRYARTTFPQDLMFLNTPDQSNFQGRYVIHHPVQGELNCEEGKEYKKTLRMRKQNELHELAALTGWSTSKWHGYLGSATFTPDAIVPTTPTVRDTNLPRNHMPIIGYIPQQGKTLRVTPAGFIVKEDTVQEGVAATDSAAGALTSGLVNEAESIATSNQFLAAATSKGKPAITKNMWLIGIAGLMFIGGMLVRLLGRKTSKK
jgi:hypothetical protein